MNPTTGQPSGGNGQAPTAATGANGQAPATVQANTTDTGTSASPHDNGTGNGQAPTGQASTDGAQQQQQLTEAERRYQQEAAEARREAAKFRKEAEALRQAAMSDDERKAARYAQMEREHADALAELQNFRLKDAAMREGKGLGLEGERLDAALKLMDRAKLETNEDGTPKNLAKLLADTLKEYAFLAAPQTPAAPSPATDPNAAAQQTQQNANLGTWGRPPASSGPAMNPARGNAQPAQAAPNRPLRGWDAVNWKP